MEQGGGQGQGQGHYQHYHSYPPHSPSSSQESLLSILPPPPPTFGTPVSSSGYSEATGASAEHSLQHAHSEPASVLPPPTFHSHAHYRHSHGLHQPNAGEGWLFGIFARLP